MPRRRGSRSARKLVIAQVGIAASVALVVACQGDDPTLVGAPAPAPDAAAVDAGTPDVAKDAATPAFCQTHAGEHDFCSDFDTVARVGDGWTVAEVRGDSDPPAFADVASSPPHSMRSTVRYTPDGGADVPVARLSYQKPFPTAGQHPALHIEFSLFIDRADERNVIMTGIELPKGLGLYLRTLPVDGGTPTRCEVLVVQGTDVTAVLDQKIDFKAWTRVALTVAPRALPQDGSDVGGGFTVEIGSAAQTFLLPAQGIPTTFRADIGLAVSNNVGADWTAYYDDVLIDGAK